MVIFSFFFLLLLILMLHNSMFWLAVAGFAPPLNPPCHHLVLFSFFSLSNLQPIAWLVLPASPAPRSAPIRGRAIKAKRWPSSSSFAVCFSRAQPRCVLGDWLWSVWLLVQTVWICVSTAAFVQLGFVCYSNSASPSFYQKLINHFPVWPSQ